MRVVGKRLGMLKVKVVRGKGLAVRDFISSDPYVVVKLGNQMVKTRVIKSCLNPVWNDELTFLLTEPFEVLNLQVFDKDFLTKDDEMGYAFLHLQPMVSAARLRTLLPVSSENKTLGMFIPDKSNCVARESYITSLNGEVVVNVWLRLRDVESGEIEVTVKFINFPLLPSF